MTLDELLKDIEKWRDLPAGYITDNATLKAQAIRDINDKKYEIETLILNAQDEFDYDDSNHTDFPMVTTPLTVNRDYRITVAERVLKIKRLEVFWDGTNGVKGHIIDSSEMDFSIDDPNTDSHFDSQTPGYDLKYGSWFLYPKATQEQVDAGAYADIEWTREGTQFATDGSDDAVEPGFDRPFHSLLSKKVAFDSMAIKRSATPAFTLLKEEIPKQEELLKLHFGNKAQDRNLNLRSNINLSDFS